ncbi:PREDICTED: ecto-ADP-ribosyltransferase 4 [Bison bison bison]|uniref:NAD(P)(+)--arginine ADP-ribosyltransferase n=1 Tax=Bison bison bison TaxID=43346 RepID=A0A6P3IRY8_BISBB|nr:PREDICTED: ecto-ADP-ribosyltransferase 4 [Bison bison bison]
MELRGQRNALHTDKCCPLTNHCRRILLANTAASAVRIWLLRGQLLLLLLCSGLQRPTGIFPGIKAASPLSPALQMDSFEEALLPGYMEELESSKHYRKVWHQTHLNWLNQEKPLPGNMTITHALAVSVYLSDDRVHLDFSRAMASAAGSPQQYKHSFRFKYLHYFLTSAIQLLRKEIVSRKDSLCYEVQHEWKGVYLRAPVGAIVRFGQFLSTSPAREQAQRFGNQTLFTMLTCLGAPVQDFSLKKEVLVPPYELFKVVNVSYHPRGNWLQLLSNGTQSTYNCQLLKASSRKCIPTPLVVASLSFLTSLIVFSKSGA